MTKPGSGIDITQWQITGLGAAMYVAGACVGALFFGWLTDRFGRKKLFMITLGVYLAATAMTALSFAPWWFFLFRFLTGFGIGGEYSAINSAIDELIPSLLGLGHPHSDDELAGKQTVCPDRFRAARSGPR